MCGFDSSECVDWCVNARAPSHTDQHPVVGGVRAAVGRGPGHVLRAPRVPQVQRPRRLRPVSRNVYVLVGLSVESCVFASFACDLESAWCAVPSVSLALAASGLSGEVAHATHGRLALVADCLVVLPVFLFLLLLTLRLDGVSRIPVSAILTPFW